VRVVGDVWGLLATLLLLLFLLSTRPAAAAHCGPGGVLEPAGEGGVDAQPGGAHQDLAQALVCTEAGGRGGRRIVSGGVCSIWRALLLGGCMPFSASGSRPKLLSFAGADTSLRVP